MRPELQGAKDLPNNGPTELHAGEREEVGYRDASKDEYLEYRLRFFEFVLLYPEELHKYVPP